MDAYCRVVTVDDWITMKWPCIISLVILTILSLKKIAMLVTLLIFQSRMDWIEMQLTVQP